MCSPTPKGGGGSSRAPGGRPGVGDGRGIPFGGPRGSLTDLYFLVCCTDDRTHLRVMARLSRLMLREGLIEELRATNSAAEAYEVLTTAERELLST